MNNLHNLFTRLEYGGGEQQQDRMILDKTKTLKRAVKYSYQGAKVQLLNSDTTFPALMNPNKLLADYDEKTLSVEYGHGFKTGEIFRWINPSRENGDTYWLIYLQDLTELAYFRADVRRCSYSIAWVDENGDNHSTYIAIKGPKETQIKTINKSEFMMDLPNYTITILMPKNEKTLSHFKRYTKFYLQGLSQGSTPVCWQVESVDSITLPGILTIHATENYINNDEDNVLTGEIGGLIEPIISKEQIALENEIIVGDNFIKPGYQSSYTYLGTDQPHWSWDTTLPIIADIQDNVITIVWDAAYSGEFTLSCNNGHKTVVIESLF